MEERVIPRNFIGLPHTYLTNIPKSHQIMAYLSCQVSQVAAYLRHRIGHFGSHTPFLGGSFATVEVGEVGRHFENMAIFKAGDIMKLKTCKRVESQEDLWEIMALDGFACSIVNLADRLRAEEQGLNTTWQVNRKRAP
jgi:hypothetical protein